jgi:phosphatidyl-myo-inositol dimannoside synthase
MRILLVTDKSLPSQGGSQVIFHQVYRQLPAGSVKVLTRRYASSGQSDAEAPYPIERVPFVDIPKLRMPLLWLTLAAATPRALRSFGADQIHCGQSIETGMIGWWCRRRYGLPYVVHTFLEELMVYRRGAATRRLLRRVLGEAEAVTTISRFSRTQLIELGVDPGRIHLLYPGVSAQPVEAEAAAAIRRRYHLDGRQVLLTVGRLAPRKGHDRVIRALPSVLKAVPSVTYLVVGDGPERPRLQHLAASLGLADRVVFVGGVAHHEVPTFYHVSDLFLMANRELPNGDVEGFGLVFLEANAAGLPVIGGRSGGTADAIVHGETGWLVDPDDLAGLADGITRLLQDHELARRFGGAGRQRVASEFTWERAGSVVEGFSRAMSDRPVFGAGHSTLPGSI